MHGHTTGVRLPGKRNSNSHGARPVHLTIKMITWIWTSRLSIKNSLPQPPKVVLDMHGHTTGDRPDLFAPGAGE